MPTSVCVQNSPLGARCGPVGFIPGSLRPGLCGETFFPLLSFVLFLKFSAEGALWSG
jgi:hypothetical protein